MPDPASAPDTPAAQPAPFSYDLAAARAGAAKAGLTPAAADAQINNYLAPLRGYDLTAALAGAAKAGVPADVANAQIAEFLAPAPAAPAPTPQTSATGAFVHAAAEGALPATGGMAAAGLGAETGAALGAMIPGAGETGIPEVVGGLAGGLTGYFGGAAAVGKVQQAVIGALPASVQRAIGEAPEQVQARATQHPYATMLGGLAPNMLFLRPGAIEQAAENAPAIVKFMANPIAARAFGAGTNAALEAAQEGQQGQGYDPVKIAIAAGAGALMNRETALGQGVSGVGAGIAARAGDLLSPRPGIAPAPTPEAAAASILAAPDVDDSIAAAEDLAQRQTPIDVGKVAGELDTGEPGDQQQAKLLRMFGNLGSGTVEHDGSGGYQFRTTGPDGGEVTHPITPWDPDAPPAEDGQPTIAPTSAQAIRDHYAAAGIDTVFYQDDPEMRFDGAMDPRQPDTIFVSNNPVRAVAQVAGHEFTHVLATTTLPDGTSLGDLFNRQIAASLTPEGQRYAAATFGQTAPARSAFPEGPEGDAPHAAAVQAHLVNELGADIGAEAPKFQTFLPQVVDAVQRRFGNTVAADVLGKLIGGVRAALDTVRGLFGNTATESQNWVTNLGDIHDTLAQMYAERFGSPVEREQAALAAMRDHAARDAFVAAPQGPQEGVSEVAPAADERGAAEALTGKALTLRRWAGELSAEQQAAAAASPQARLLRQTEAAILGPVGGDAAALPPADAARLEAVRSQLAAATEPPDSPALAAVKSELDATVAAAKAARRGPSPYSPIPREPKRLIQFLRESNVVGSGLNAETIPGGVVDHGGDVAQIIGGPAGRPGLINNRTGRPLDAQTERAWEAGYFPGHVERPEINDLLEAIREDHTGIPRYSIHDQDAVDAYQNAIGQNAEIDRIASETGIDPAGMTYEEFGRAVAAHADAPAPEDVARQDDAEYAEFADMAPDEVGGEPRSLEDLEDEYRQAEASEALGGDEEGDAGRGPFPGGEGAGEEGPGPGFRGAPAGLGPEADDAALGPAFSPRRLPLPPQTGTDLLGRAAPEARTRAEAEPTIRDDRRQVDMFGTADAAVQAQAARDQAGRGALLPGAAQKAPDEGLFARPDAKEPTLFSPRTPHDRPAAEAAAREQAAELRRPEDDVSALIDAIATERGGMAAPGSSKTVEDRVLSRVAELGIKQEKNLNWVEQKQSIFPHTLAALDDKFASYYRAFLARQREGDANAHDLRSTISDTLVKLPPASRDRVYAALELARKWNARPTDPDLRVRVRNNSYWQAQKSKVGDDYILSTEETHAFHDVLRLGDEGWHMFMTALVRREGWKGEVDPAAIKAAAAGAGLHLPEGKRLMRLATALEAAQKNAASAYFPAMRFGDVYLAVTPKVGPDLDNVSAGLGRPQVQWFQTVERGATRDLLGLGRTPTDQMQEVKDAIAALAQRTDNAGKPAFGGEFKNTSPGVWESATHRIETGNLSRNPEALRQLNIPAIEKLFMLMERHATAKVIQDVMAEQTPEEGLDPKEAAEMKRRVARYGNNFNLTGGEAFDRYQALLGKTKDTLLDALYHDLLAGWKKRASLTPGYSADFDRAIGTHIGQVSRNAADMVHREAIDAAYQDIQDNHPHRAVKEYTRDFQRYQDDPRSPLAHAAQSANQVGFAYALAANPASTLKIALHSGMMSAPVMSVGIGMRRVAAELASASAEAYRNIRFDTANGAQINTAGLGRTDGEKAFIAQLDREGLLHSVGADDIRGINDRQAGLWGQAAPLMRRAMDIASSNISVVDQANRSAVALAAYRIAQNKSALMLATKPLMEHNALFRAEVQRAVEQKMAGQFETGQGMPDAQTAALREVYPRFMLDQAGGQFGRANQAPAMRGAEGSLFFALHGFQTRYLSTMLSLVKNSGPEGKIAAAWMMGGLAMVAGVAGLPFVQDIENGGDAAWKAVTHVDPMIDAHLREWLGDAGFSKVGADILMRGPASALFGVDGSGSLGFGDVISRSMTPSNALGTIPSMLYERLKAAYNRESTGQGAATVAAEMLPSALRNPAQAAIQARLGVVSPRGEMEFPARKITGADTARRALGFASADIAQARENAEYAYALKAHDAELRQDIPRSVALLNLRASAAERDGDHATAASLRAEANDVLAAHPGLMLTEQAYKDAEFEMANPTLYRLTRTPMRLRGQLENSPYP